MCKRDHAIRFERAVGLVLAALLSACSGGGGAPALPGAASTPSPALGSGLPAAPAPPATTGALDLTVANAYVDQGQQTAS
ncbi:MAG: hypothetical protein ACREM8_08060, partial [Vulcanimicrobiaceae bacterium]